MSTETERRTMKGARRLRDGSHIYWWVEILAILLFYVVYSAVRNLNGSHPPSAFAHQRPSATGSFASTMTCSQTRVSESVIDVVVDAQVRDLLLAHHPPQRVLELRQLDEQVVLGV